MSEIATGLLVLVGVKPEDDEAAGTRLLQRILKYRIFPDDAGKMNLNLMQIEGELLLVPQFTLAADTRHGLRPGFSTAAPPAHALSLFSFLVSAAHAQYPRVHTGVFGADMQVALVNDGPVTLWLES